MLFVILTVGAQAARLQTHDAHEPCALPEARLQNSAAVQADSTVFPKSEIPDDHLAYFGLRGAVKEVREYDYGGWGKTIWRFDRQGRLTEYIDYGNPFFGSGGCVFGLLDHYRYDYDENGKIIFLETYNADNNVVDEYADVILELFPPKCNDADLFPKAEKEYGDTTFCFSVWKDDDELQHYYGHRFDRYGNWIESVSASEDDYYCADVRVREITYYEEKEVPLESLAALPEKCDEETAFGLDLDYQGYVFEASLYPLHDSRWIVLSHWCLDEEETIYMVDADGNEVPASSQYKDPFEGITYSVIKTDSVSFITRNYGGQTLNFYATSDGDEVACSTNYNEINLWVVDADPVTRRVLVRTNPLDGCWIKEGREYSEEELQYVHPYIELRGWLDEEWICANLLSTCP